MSTFVYPYNTSSSSSKNLRKGLEAKGIKLKNSKFKGSEEKVVINWGNSSINEEVLKCKVLNHPDCIKLASNKLQFFELVKDKISIPEFTKDKEEAKTWLDEGVKVVVREKLEGHSGEGIIIFNDEVSWGEYNHSRAKLYVKYVPKRDEYRVHVMGDKIIDVQRKAIRNEYSRDQVNFQIRNHDNGFMYVRNNVDPDQKVLDYSIEAVKLSGLDFGAVDVIWNEYRNEAFVLEINTAPGLEGQTLDNYVKGLSEMVPNIRQKLKKSKNLRPAFNFADVVPDRNPFDIIDDIPEGVPVEWRGGE